MIYLEDDSPRFQVVETGKPTRNKPPSKELFWQKGPAGWSQVPKAAIVGTVVPREEGPGPVVPSATWLCSKVRLLDLASLLTLERAVAAAIKRGRES